MKKAIFLISIQFFCFWDVWGSCQSKEFTQEKFNSLGVVFTGNILEETYDFETGISWVKFSVKNLYKGNLKEGFIYARGGQYISHNISNEIGINYLFLLEEYNGENFYNNTYSQKIKIDDEVEFKLPDWLIPFLNIEDGHHKYFYKNGNIASEGVLKAIIPEGPWKYYDSCGNLTSYGNYIKGKLDSTWNYTYYSIQGNYKVSYKQGKMNGPCISYHNYGDNETEMFRYNYVDGARNGKFYEFSTLNKSFQQGSVSYFYYGYEGEYLNDKLLWSLTYYEDGTKAEFRSDLLEVKWNRMGTKVYERSLKNKTNYFLQSWWDNGRPKLVMKSNVWREDKVIFASKKDGTIMVKNGEGYYDMDGSKGYYKDTLKSGIWVFDNNVTKKIQGYKKGIKHGKYRKYAQNKTLIEKASYKKGSICRKFRSWYGNGNKRSKLRFEGKNEILISFWEPDGKQTIKRGNGIYLYYDYEGNTRGAKPIKYKDGKAIK